MDISITAIERNLRLYGVPFGMMVIGGIGLLLVDPSSQVTGSVGQVLAPLKRYAFLGLGSLAMAGALWGGWRAWLEWRWANGNLVGGCYSCGGSIRHLRGRYGDYSKCLMCGAKQKGHH